MVYSQWIGPLRPVLKIPPLASHSWGQSLCPLEMVPGPLWDLAAMVSYHQCHSSLPLPPSVPATLPPFRPWNTASPTSPHKALLRPSPAPPSGCVHRLLQGSLARESCSVRCLWCCHPIQHMVSKASPNHTSWHTVAYDIITSEGVKS